MDEKERDNSQFRMRMDDTADDNVIPAQVDELRIEKLSTKVTIISIMIPVLIAVVLTIAYLDMKKRVARTQDTGTTGVENLTKDMESRFSTISNRQANLEEMIKKMRADNDKAIARIQVKLKKLEDTSKGIKKTMISPSVLEDKTAKLQKEINNVAKAVETANGQVAETARGLKEEMQKFSSSAAQYQDRIAQIDEKLTGLDQTKIDKASLDLALKLEALKIKKNHKAQLDDILDRIHRLEQQSAMHKTPRASNPNPSAETSSQPPAPQPKGGIVEQPIGK